MELIELLRAALTIIMWDAINRLPKVRELDNSKAYRLGHRIYLPKGLIHFSVLLPTVDLLKELVSLVQPLVHL